MITKKEIAQKVNVRRIHGNSYFYSFETDDYIFSCRPFENSIIAGNKNNGTSKQYGEAYNKKEFVNNVHEFLNA